MYTNQEIKYIVDQITYMPGWSLRLIEDGGNRVLLQVVGEGPCPKTGEVMPWTGRKWALSPYMCKNEIIRTAYMAYRTAVLHEFDEHFRYLGAAIFNPHMNYDLIADMAGRDDFENVREDSIYGV